jgi:hypothetical protein
LGYKIPSKYTRNFFLNALWVSYIKLQMKGEKKKKKKPRKYN